MQKSSHFYSLSSASEAPTTATATRLHGADATRRVAGGRAAPRLALRVGSRAATQSILVSLSCTQRLQELGDAREVLSH